VLLAEHGKIALTDLLLQARSGSGEALGQLLEACRVYLLVVARQELQMALQAKVDAADLVQDTFMEAMRDFADFHGDCEQQLLGWLRGILRHNVADLNRRFARGCRCLAQEVPLRTQLAALLPSPSTASGRTTICEQVIAQEQRRAVIAALQRLSPCYRQVLQLRYDERCTFAEIGNRLQRSPEAARKLWERAIERLRHDLLQHHSI
jgi:RNA polymerase sigma-70 factor (ECF subfamily)